MQKETEIKISQIKPVLSKELPSRAELEAEYNDVKLSLVSMTTDEVIPALVDIARDNGIDVSEEAAKFRIPIAGIGAGKIGDVPCGIVYFNGIQVQGEVDDVINFISDIQSGIDIEEKHVKTVTVTGISLSERTVPYPGEEGIRKATNFVRKTWTEI